MKTLSVVAANLLIAGLALAPSAPGEAASAGRGTKTVKVGDDFFSPTVTRIVRGSSVKWVWSSRNDNQHDVSLKTAPNGVRKGRFQSSTESAGFRFTRRFAKAGRYGFICNIHPDDMRMTVRVRR